MIHSFYKTWIVIVVVLLVFFPYITSMSLTHFFAKQFGSVCGHGGYVVVLSYTKQNQSAEIYCIYQEASKNERLRVVQNDDGNWKVDSRSNISKTLYWPFIIY